MQFWQWLAVFVRLEQPIGLDFPCLNARLCAPYCSQFGGSLLQFINNRSRLRYQLSFY